MSYPPDMILDGLEFILNHFEEPIWPRTISTHSTEGRQILAYNKEEAIARYKQASLLDCRINAYPDYTEYGGINRESSKRSKYHHHKYNATSKKEIKWIETLLQTPIDDYRKNAIWRILAPYLINTKNLTYEESYNIIKEWLDKCSSLKSLDSYPSYYIKYNLNNAIRVKYFPMKFDDLKVENTKLYNILKDKISDRT